MDLRHETRVNVSFMLLIKWHTILLPYKVGLACTNCAQWERPEQQQQQQQQRLQ